jgi:hypothetical protein
VTILAHGRGGGHKDVATAERCCRGLLQVNKRHPGQKGKNKYGTTK